MSEAMADLRGGDVEVRTSEAPVLHVVPRLREILRARELLVNLTRKEVKIKYKSSVLGALWSMMNPILYLLIFTLVFKIVLGNKTPHFPVYLLSGLLAWNVWANSLTLSARSVVDNANLVTKVYFPREILPLASLGSALVDFVLQAVVLLAFMLITRAGVLGPNLALLPLAILPLLLITAAVSFWVASLNVRYRDTQHLLALALLAMFWMTPVVYPSGLIYARLSHHHLLGIPLSRLFLLNPVADVVFGFQRALYGVVSPPGVTYSVLLPVSVVWLAMLLGAVTVGSFLLLWLAWRAYFRLSGDFAEEL